MYRLGKRSSGSDRGVCVFVCALVRRPAFVRTVIAKWVFHSLRNKP